MPPPYQERGKIAADFFMTLLMPEHYSVVERVQREARYRATLPRMPCAPMIEPPAKKTTDMAQVSLAIAAILRECGTHDVDCDDFIEELYRHRFVREALEASKYSSMLEMASLEARGNYQITEDLASLPMLVQNPDKLPILTSIDAERLFSGAIVVIRKNARRYPHAWMPFQAFAVGMIEYFGCLRTERSFTLAALRLKMSFCPRVKLTYVRGNGKHSESTTYTIEEW